MRRLATNLLLPLLALGLSACVTAADRRADLRAAFHDQIKRCYMVPVEAAGEESVVIDVRLKPDGSLAQTPKVLRGSPNSAVAKAAIRAFNRCTPFVISPDMAGRYADWKIMNIRFDTRPQKSGVAPTP